MIPYLTATGAVSIPLLLLAAVTLWGSVRFLATARREDLLVACAGSAGSLIFALLGLAVGFQLSVLGVRVHGTNPELVLAGVSESLNGLVLALLTCLLATLLLSFGGYRSLRAARVASGHPSREAGSRACRG